MKKVTILLATLFVLASVAIAVEVTLQPVDSSLIAQVGYDEATRQLAIRMHNSSDTYLYKDVPPAVYADFIAADSKGAFYVKNIKGHYDTERQ